MKLNQISFSSLKMFFTILFISSFPILNLYLINTTKVEFVEVIGLIFIISGTSCALFILMKLFLKSWPRAFILIFIYSTLFSSYGHVEIIFLDWEWLNDWAAKRILTLGYFLLFLALTFLCWRITEKMLKGVIEVVFTATAILLFFLAINFLINLNFIFNFNEIKEIENYKTHGSKLEFNESKPDVYLIVVDSYGSPSVLQRLFGFIDPLSLNLKERSFNVAENQYSNYDSTLPSMASILNMRYINETYIDGKSDLIKYELQKDLINNSEVTNIFKGLGYNNFAINSPAVEKDFSFSSFYLSTTIAKPLQRHRDYYINVHNSLTAFDKATLLPGPKFIYYHFDLPHAPFIFDDKCEYTSRILLSSSSGHDGYLNQSKCARQIILSIIDKLKKINNGNSIILIMSDHGPPVGVAGVPVGEVGDRLGIISAIYSTGCKNLTSILNSSPVNYFRKIFNECFNASYEYLPNLYFNILWSKDRELTDITSEVKHYLK